MKAADVAMYIIVSWRLNRKLVVIRIILFPGSQASFLLYLPLSSFRKDERLRL